MKNISKHRSHLHFGISIHGCDGVICLIHSWLCGIGHGNSFNIGFYLAKTNFLTSSPSQWCTLRFVKPSIYLSSLCVGAGVFSDSNSFSLTSAATKPWFFACHSYLLSARIIFLASSDTNLHSGRKWSFTMPHPWHFPLKAFIAAVSPWSTEATPSSSFSCNRHLLHAGRTVPVFEQSLGFDYFLCIYFISRE